MSPRVWWRAWRYRRNRRHVPPWPEAEMRVVRDVSPRPFGRDGS